MKIPPSSDPKASVTYDPSAAPRRTEGAAAPVAGAGKDQVKLSTHAAADAPAVADASFDKAKVEAIKDAIRNGTLTVDSGIVADQMVAQALALAAKNRG
jgi:negative regulator of flagellin synthesis FlgM